MSKYSGKCDLADVLEIYKYTLEEIKEKVRIYVGASKKPLHIEKESDLIPYYPYVVVSSYSSEDRSADLHLTDESWVDREERVHLLFRLKMVLKYYNHCKRKHVPFDKEEALKQICYGNFNRDVYEELVNRVSDFGKRASIDGLHLQMHDVYRRELVREMLDKGLNPAEYGYGRFCTSEI